MRAIALGLVAAAIPFAAASALPQLSAGSRINIVGDATYDTTTVTFISPGDLVAGAGDYVPLGTCTGCVSIVTPVTFSPFTSVHDLFDASNNGLVATISITSEIAPPQVGSDTLDLVDNAVLALTGFADTPGKLAMTINEFGELEGSFSATGAPFPVPEPMPVAVLGLGLLGLGLAKGRTR